MKTFEEFQRKKQPHYGAYSHTVRDPVTGKQIKVPKGHSIPVSRSSSKGGGSSGNGNGGNGE